MGCRLNQSETALICEQFRRQGYQVVKWGQISDVAVINTCTVTLTADSKARHAIRSAIRTNPQTFVAVVGCYSQMGYKVIADIPGVDLIIGNQEKLNLLDYLPDHKQESPVIIRNQITRDDFSIEVVGQADLTTRANLKIQDGCDFMCTFCIIPFARGRSRSRDFQNLCQEARELAKQGFKELVLTGVNVGTFASGDRTVVDVVDALHATEGIERIRISSIEPTTIPKGLLDRMNDSEHALVPYLHTPLQSACDPILQLMKRKYSAQEYFDYLQFAQNKVPGIALGTDVMVGFPGESEDLFAEMYERLANSPLMYFHVFSYSQREGTPAVKYEDQVSPEDKKKRSARLRMLSELKRKAYYKKFKGKELDVLFETSDNGYWFGYSQEYIRVGLASDQDLSNQIIRVKIKNLAGDFMEGCVG